MLLTSGMPQSLARLIIATNMSTAEFILECTSKEPANAKSELTKTTLVPTDQANRKGSQQLEADNDFQTSLPEID
jgi:hypothetical protein